MPEVNDRKLTIGFKVIDEFGDEYEMTSKADVNDMTYDSDLDYFGEKFNVFLKQCGYYRKNDYIFMKDITPDEYDALEEYLAEMRSNKSDEE